MIDVGFFDRVRGGLGVHDVLKGGVIKGEGLTGFSVVQIRVCRGRRRGWITCGSVSGWLLGVGSMSWVFTALFGGGVDLVVALCFLSSLMATSLKSL